VVDLAGREDAVKFQAIQVRDECILAPPVSRPTLARERGNTRCHDYGLEALTLVLSKGMIAPVLAGVCSRTERQAAQPASPSAGNGTFKGRQPLPRAATAGDLLSRYTPMILRRRGAGSSSGRPAKVNECSWIVMGRRAEGYNELAS